MPASRLRTALVSRAAAQWTALGVTLTGPSEPTVIDPEGLIGLTAVVGGADERVRQGAIAWCGRHGRFINGARLKRVVAELGVEETTFHAFAAAARDAGAPPWTARPTDGRDPRVVSNPDGLVVVIPVRSASRLLWFLRAAFGVNARADIVASLLARPGARLTVLELAQLTRFTKRNVAVALEDLRLARVVERGGGTVGRFQLRDPGGLLRWLDQPAAVRYPDWVAQLTVGLRALAFVDRSFPSERVRAIEARSAVAGLLPALERTDLPRPDLAATGAAFSSAFDAWVDELAGRWEVKA